MSDEEKTEPQDGAEASTTDKTTTTTSKRKRKRKRSKKTDHTTENTAQAEETPATTTLTADETTKTQEVDRTIFVEGIPFTCTPDQIRDFFAQHLKHKSDAADDDDDPLIVDLRLPVWHDSGRLRGYGHVVFQTTEQREAALALSGQYLNNRYLTIQKAQAPKGATRNVAVDHSNPSATVALHNLSYEATEDDIQAVMETYGSIADGGVRLVRHSDTGRPKGFGYVQFTDVSAAQKAVKAAPIVIAGRPCRVDYDHGRVRGSFRTADRKLWHKEHGRNQRARGNDTD